MGMHWASKLGLAQTPLFAGELVGPGRHFLLLDGVQGSFGLSLVDAVETTLEPRDWAWSSGVLHHVTASPDRVVVQRWDRPEVASFQASAVNEGLARFYELMSREQSGIARTVSDHAVDAFRRLRSHFPSDRGEDALSAFLLIMSGMIEGRDELVFDSAESLAERYELPIDASNAIAELSPDFVTHLINGFRHPVLPRSIELTTWPSLLLRHAGAMVFQEAHFELASRGALDMFGVPEAAALKLKAPGGVHYTPPGLARALAEQALHALGPLPRELTILDPACGSGSILHELLRILRDRAYGGKIRVIGFDQSPVAVQMTRFFMAASRRDWSDLEIESVSVNVRNALDEEPWPACDLVVMNPPFISLRSLSAQERAAVGRVLGSFDKGRPDMAMAFVERALSSVRDQGVVASLVPAGILSMTYGHPWREHILERATLHLVASFGEVSLFRMATVEVGAVVLQKSAATKEAAFKSLWVGEKKGATSQALRFLRRAEGSLSGGLEEDRWSLEVRAKSDLANGGDWRPRPSFLKRELAKFLAQSPTTVGDVFHVRQGALPAPRAAFIIDQAQYDQLPDPERIWFRQVAENSNIRAGQILPGAYVFFSRTAGLPSLSTQKDLERYCPHFFSTLVKNKPALASRRGKSGRWWELGEDRSWLRSPAPKIVTAYFGQSGSFAVDAEGDYVVVQGYGWLPRWSRTLPDGVSDIQLLHAYAGILNTEVFQRILGEFCPMVGGGQLNLSRRFVSKVPIPDLAARAALSDGDDQMLRDLISIGMSIDRRGLPYSPRAQAEDITRALYGLR